MPKELYEKQEYSKIDVAVIIILAIIILDLQIFGIFGRTTFLQDQVIIFEGGYRISSGQVPYQDFFIPMGPVVFYMQGFFNFIFGNNIISMALFGFFLSIIICIPFYYIVRKEFGILMSFLFAFFLYLSFQGLSFYVYYNFLPYFFLFINIFILYSYSKEDSFHDHLPRNVYLINALLIALAFYTKQDIGLFSLAMILIYFIYNYPKDWKSILFFYIVPLAVLFIGTFFLLYQIPNFSTHFILSQHNSRLNEFINPTKIVNAFESWVTYFIAVFVLMIIFMKKILVIKKKIRVMSLFLVIGIVTVVANITSGSARQHTVMGIPIMIFFLWILIKDYISDLIKKYKISINIILILILLWSLNPIPTYGLITLNYLNPNMGHISEGCYKNYLMSNDNLIGLEKIREIIEENNKSFISMTEYSFLYCDYNINPLKGLPLWFHKRISYYEEDIPGIIAKIILYNPKIILVESPHNDGEDEKFVTSFESAGYKEEFRINKTSSGMPIIVLIKDK